MTMWALRHPSVVGAPPLLHGWEAAGGIAVACAGALLVTAAGVLQPPLGAKGISRSFTLVFGLRARRISRLPREPIGESSCLIDS